MSKQRPLLLPWLVSVEWAVLLFFPARPVTFLNGIPLNTPLEYGLFTVLLLNIFLYGLNRYGVALDVSMTFKRIFSKSFDVVQRYHGWLFAIGLLLRSLLFASNGIIPSSRFQVSYYPPTLEAQHYLNFDNPFNLRDTTYLSDRLLWNGRGRYEVWHLNDADYPQTGKVVLRGSFTLSKGSRFRIISSGLVQGHLGSLPIHLESAELKETNVELTPERDVYDFQLEAPLSPASYLEAQHAAPEEGWKTIHSSHDGSLVLSLALVGVSVLLLLGGLLLSVQILARLQLTWGFLMLPVFTLAVLWGLRMSSLSLLLMIAYAGALLEKLKRQPIRYLNWIVLIVLCALVYFLRVYSFDTVEIRSPGNDPLTYERFGRAVIKGLSLEAGEPSFFYQPGFRYYMTGLLCAFGEYNIFPKFINVSIFLTVYWLLFMGLEQRIRSTWVSRTAAFVALGFIGREPIRNVLFNLTEFLSWILIAVACLVISPPLRFERAGRITYNTRTLPVWAPYLFAGCLALAGINRPNQTVGLFSMWVLWALIYLSFSSERKAARSTVLGSFAVYLSVMLFPLWHNWYFGHEWLLFSAGATQNPATLVLSPSLVLFSWTSPDVQKQLMHHVRHLLVWIKPVPGVIDGVSIAGFQAILILFAVSSVRMWRMGGKRLVAAAWGVVAAFAGVHLFYRVTNYYPRHIIVVYMAMSLFGVIQWASAGKSGQNANDAAGRQSKNTE